METKDADDDINLTADKALSPADTAEWIRPRVDIDGTGISIEADNNADASIVLKTNNTGVTRWTLKIKRPSSQAIRRNWFGADIDIDAASNITLT